MGAVSHGGTDARGFDKEFTRWTVPNVETLSGDKTITSVDARIQLLNPGGATRTVTLDTSLHVVGTVIYIQNTVDSGDALQVLNSAATNLVTLTYKYNDCRLLYNGSGWTFIEQPSILKVSNTNYYGLSYGGLASGVTQSVFGVGAAGCLWMQTNSTSWIGNSFSFGIGASPSSLFHVTAAGDPNALRVDNTYGHVGLGAAANQYYKLWIARSAADAWTRVGISNTSASASAVVGYYGTTDAGGGSDTFALYAGSTAYNGGDTYLYSYVRDLKLMSVGGSSKGLHLSATGTGVGAAPSSLFHVTASGNANALRVDNTTGQVLVGASAAITSASAVFGSATGAIVLNRWTTTERDALTATKGMMGYNTTTDKAQIYNGAWVDLH